MPTKPSVAEETFLCDTSVLVAASDKNHIHHERSIGVVSKARPQIAFCASHAIAEIYAVLTSSVYRGRLRNADVNDIIKAIRKTFTVVSLTPDEYFLVSEEGLMRNIQGGQIYDALHLAIAKKCKVDWVYTWNLKHFKNLAAAELSSRVEEPPSLSVPSSRKKH